VVEPRSVATERDDEQLVIRLRAGDEDAFCALVRRHTASMTRVAMAFVSRRAVAEEVVQETWLNVVRSIQAFEGRSSLRTWIFTILGNCARRRAEQERRLVSVAELASEEAAGDDIGVSSTTSSTAAGGPGCGRPSSVGGRICRSSDCCPASCARRSSKRSRPCRECREP